MQIPTYCQIFRALPDAAIRMWLNKAICLLHCNWRPAGVLWKITNTIQCRDKRPIDDIMTWKRFPHYWLFVKGIWAWVSQVMPMNWLLMQESWWRHQMETLSVLLAICAGNSPVPGEFPHKGQWRGALMFSLICVWINGWVNNREAGDLRRRHAHYNVTVMWMAGNDHIWMPLIAVWLRIAGLITQHLRWLWFECTVHPQNMHSFRNVRCLVLVRYDLPYTSAFFTNFNPRWIINHTPCNVWDEITYPFPNFNGCTVDVWEWINNFIPHFIMDVITYLCWDQRLIYIVEGAPCAFLIMTGLKVKKSWIT